MKLTINRDILFKAVRRWTLPALPSGNPANACCLLSARLVEGLPGGLDLKTTNGVVGGASMVACRTEAEGDLFVHTKSLATTLGTMPTGELSLSIEPHKDKTKPPHLVVKGGNRRVRLPTRSLEDARPVPDMPAELHQVSMPASELLTLIERVEFGVDNVDKSSASSLAYRGIFLDLDDKHFSSIVVGNHVVIVNSGPSVPGAPWSALLPDHVEIRRLAREIATEDQADGGRVKLARNDAYVWIENSSTVLVYSPPPAEYLDWRSVVARIQILPVCRLPRMAMMESLRALLAASTTQITLARVRLETTGNLILDYEDGEADVRVHDEVPVLELQTDAQLSFAVNAQYFLDALDAASINPLLGHVSTGQHIALTTEEGFCWMCALMDVPRASSAAPPEEPLAAPPESLGPKKAAGRKPPKE